MEKGTLAKAGLKAVLFDLDGVIVDTAKYHYIAWRNLADNEGIYFDELINERLKGVSRMGSLEILLEKSGRLYSSEEKNKMCETKNNFYIEMINRLTPDEILPGVIEFLQSIKNEGIKTAVCSASRSAGFILDKLELSGYFDTVVGGNDVKKAKPDPEVFMIASERFGISPCECAVIEDAFAGLEAAKTIGMKAIGIGDNKILSNADVVYKNMKVFSLEDIKGLWRLA